MDDDGRCWVVWEPAAGMIDLFVTVDPKRGAGRALVQLELFHGKLLIPAETARELAAQLIAAADRAERDE